MLLRKATSSPLKKTDKNLSMLLEEDMAETIERRKTIESLRNLEGNEAAQNVADSIERVHGKVEDGKKMLYTDIKKEDVFLEGEITWGNWSDYNKVKSNGQYYAEVGNRLYSRHAINRIQPSGNRFGVYIYQGLDGVDYGRSVAPKFIEYVIRNSEPAVQENGNLLYKSGTLSVITNDRGAVVTIITYKK